MNFIKTFFIKRFCKESPFAGGDAVRGDGVFGNFKKEIAVPQVINVALLFAKVLHFGSIVSIRAGDNGDLGVCDGKKIRGAVLFAVMGKLEHLTAELVFSVVADHRTQHFVGISLVTGNEGNGLAFCDLDPKGIAVCGSVGIAVLRVILVGGGAVFAQKANALRLRGAILRPIELRRVKGDGGGAVRQHEFIFFAVGETGDRAAAIRVGRWLHVGCCCRRSCADAHTSGCRTFRR